MRKFRKCNNFQSSLALLAHIDLSRCWCFAGSLWCVYIQGGPRKNATPTINNFKKTRDRMKKKIMKAFWFYGRFSEAMSFSRFALLSQKSQFTYRKFSIVWLPRVKCLLLPCKAKLAWIKRSIHYVTLQHYNPGELLKESPPYLKRDFWYKRSKFWKWHCLRKMALASKRLHQNH